MFAFEVVVVLLGNTCRDADGYISYKTVFQGVRTKLLSVCINETTTRLCCPLYINALSDRHLWQGSKQIWRSWICPSEGKGLAIQGPLFFSLHQHPPISRLP